MLLVERCEKKRHEICVIPTGAPKCGRDDRETARRQLKNFTGLDADAEDLFRMPREYSLYARVRGRRRKFHLFLFSTFKFRGELRKNRSGKPAWVRVDRLADRNLHPLVEKIIKDVFGVSSVSKYRLD